MTKTIQTREEAYIQFTDEEIADLGLKQGDEFEITPTEDGGYFFKKLEEIELDLFEFPREILESLIKESCEKNVSVNKIIRDALQVFLDKEEEELS
jgi:bifunctional DNA-binding transcriptional regulator/antitoxin component of YhaV-PrlF toxin-antitoxin module